MFLNKYYEKMKIEEIDGWVGSRWEKVAWSNLFKLFSQTSYNSYISLPLCLYFSNIFILQKTVLAVVEPKSL